MTIATCVTIDIPDLSVSLYHSSQFEEKFEEINGVDVAPKFPSTPEFNNHQSTVVVEDRGKDIAVQGQDGHGPSSDYTTAQDFVSGIMKIVPSDVDVSITSISQIFVLWICKDQFSDHKEYISCKLSILWQQNSKICRMLSFKIVHKSIIACFFAVSMKLVFFSDMK